MKWSQNFTYEVMGAGKRALRCLGNAFIGRAYRSWLSWVSFTATSLSFDESWAARLLLWLCKLDNSCQVLCSSSSNFWGRRVTTHLNMLRKKGTVSKLRGSLHIVCLKTMKNNKNTDDDLRGAIYIYIYIYTVHTHTHTHTHIYIYSPHFTADAWGYMLGTGIRNV